MLYALAFGTLPFLLNETTMDFDELRNSIVEHELLSLPAVPERSEDLKVRYNCMKSMKTKEKNTAHARYQFILHTPCINLHYTPHVSIYTAHPGHQFI